MKIIPVNDTLYIRLNEVEEQQIGRIILPDKHEERTRIGTVLATGDKVKLFKAGDKILVSYFAGIHLHLPTEGIMNDTHRILTENEVLAKVED